jgi:hypothetical protein
MAAAPRQAVRVHNASIGASKQIIGVELNVSSPNQLGFAVQSSPAEHGEWV